MTIYGTTKMQTTHLNNRMPNNSYYSTTSSFGYHHDHMMWFTMLDHCGCLVISCGSDLILCATSIKAVRDMYTTQIYYNMRQAHQAAVA